MTTPPNRSAQAPRLTFADIITNVLVNDQPEIMKIETLPPAVQRDIAAGRSDGLHLVSVRWVTGEFAYMFCAPGTDMPDPIKVVAAFHQCHWAKTNSNDGSAK